MFCRVIVLITNDSLLTSQQQIIHNMKRTSNKHVSLYIPQGILDELDRIIADDKAIYSSRSDIINSLLREFISKNNERTKKQKNEKD